MILDNNFNFYMPMDIQKSEQQEKPEMRIGGYASTADKDRQDDIILQKGLDISEFVNHGYFNLDHDNSKTVGYPDAEKTCIDSHGFKVEGILLNTSLGKSIWETAVALKKSHAPRRLGFSVEGKTLERDSLGRIVKAMVYNVAITNTPVNVNATFDALCKSFSPEIMDKSMSAGYSSKVGEVNNGACLKPEDLECAFRTLAKALGGNEDASEALNIVKGFLNKSVNTEELALYFQLSKGLSRQESLDLITKLNS